MTIRDYAHNPISPSSASFAGWGAAEVFPHDIYSFLIESLRQCDRDAGDLLVLRFLEAPQSEFEDTYERIKSLLRLYDPETTPAAALNYVKWIVGFTSRLDFLTGGLSESELRILISIGARMWKYKGTDAALAYALEAFSAYPIRVLPWFFFRTLVDEVEIGRAELDVDPWLIDQPGMNPSVYPDALTAPAELLDMDALPSVDGWTYGNEGASEGAIYSVAGGTLAHAQNGGDALGGRYFRTVSLLNAYAARMDATWTLDALVTVGGGRPWHLLLRDGLRDLVLTWSTTEVALEDQSGNVIVGPVARAFGVGVPYRMKLYKTDLQKVRASVDGADLFGEVDTTLFPATAVQQYGFGYYNRGLVQNWSATWDNAGPFSDLELDLTTLLGAAEAVPHDVRVKHVPTAEVVVVESRWTGSANVASFAADRFSKPSTDLSDYRVGVDPDEFVSDIRIVDDGTGIVNRDLVENLVKVLRPNSERYFIRFLDFQDTFRDAFYWTVEQGTNVEHDRDAGRVVLSGDLEGATVSIATDFPNDAGWSQYQAAVQFLLRDPTVGGWFQMRFYYQDALNYYAVNINPGTAEVKLYRVVGGTPLPIGAGYLSVFHPGVFYVVHVTTESVGVSGHLIQFFVDGVKMGEVVDATYSQGKLAAAVAAGQRAEVTFAEVFQFPLESRRVGP